MLALFGIALLILAIVWSLTDRNDPRLPPGIHGLPIIGSLPSFKVSLVNQIEQHRKQFGDIFLWKTGSRNVVYLCDPKIIRKALNNPYLLDRPKDLFTFDSWTYWKKIGLINSNGEAWQTHRRFTLRQLKDSGFGKSIVDDIVMREVEVFTKDLKDHYLNAPVKIPSSLFVATLNVIWTLIADIRFEKDDKELQEFLESLIKIGSLVQGYLNLFDVFPWLVPLTPTFLMKKIGFEELQVSRELIKNYLKSVVNDRRKKLDPENPHGIIDAYLLQMDSKDMSTFDDNSLIITLGDLFFAGSETTSSSIRWILLYMASYPDIQRKVQREIDSVVPKDRIPSSADKMNLPYTEATIHEVLRITSLVPIGVIHAASDNTTIEDFFIPKGTIISPFLYGCHMSSKYWEKPTEFYPDHFLDSTGKFSSQNEAFLPFSTGRRNCIGESLAKKELFLFVSSILQKFSISTPDGKGLILIREPMNVILEVPPDVELIFTERL